MIRKVVALIVGFLILNIIALSGNVLMNLKLFVANFFGGLCAGFISREKGIFYGGVVSISSCLIIVILLANIAYRVSEGKVILAIPEITIIFLLDLLAVFFGPVGGYFGEKLSKRKREKINKRGT